MLVSVCMITHNHAGFVKSAIESVMLQQTDFDLHLYIGIDACTDNTTDICKQVAGNYPTRITLLETENRLGMMENFIRTFQVCKGDYVAFIEGDDYWIDPRKIQKQVEFLEKDKSASACFHNAIKRFEKETHVVERMFHESLEKNSFNTVDLLEQWFIPSASVLFRNSPDFTLPDWYRHCKSGDIPFLLLLSLNGDIKYMDELMSVYRIHDGGVSKTHVGLPKILWMGYIYECFNIHTGYKFNQHIIKAFEREIKTHFPMESLPPARKTPAQSNKKSNSFIHRLFDQLTANE